MHRQLLIELNSTSQKKLAEPQANNQSEKNYDIGNSNKDCTGYIYCQEVLLISDV